MKPRILFAATLALALGALSFAGSACTFRVASAAPTAADQGAPAPHRRSITVTGTATLDLAPDCADVSLTLSTEGARPKLAIEDLRRKQNALVQGLIAAGVPAGDIKLGGLSLGQAFDEKGRFKAYSASITVIATTRKFDLIGDIMEAASDVGTQNMTTTFRVSDMPAYKKKVREMALKAAAEKAHETVAALDTSLGPVSDVVENAADWRALANENAYNIEVRGPAPSVTPTMQPLTLAVTVTYDLA